jgi:phage terminase small subunit
MARRKTLTGKEAKFVAALPKCNWVGTDAVIMAEYNVSGRKSASEIASQLLKKTQVKETVDRMMEERLQRAGIYAEKVLTRVAQIAYADLRKLYRSDGTLLSPNEWPEDIVPAIAGVEVFEEFQGKGEKKILVGHTKKVKMWDPNPSLTNLMKHLKLFPTERGPGVEEPRGTPVLSKMELSAKLIYIIHLALKRLKEKEQKQVNNGETIDIEL